VPLPRLLEQALVLENPFVGRGSHGHRTDGADGVVPPAFAMVGGVCLVQPIEGVVEVGDEPVDARRREVLRLGIPRVSQKEGSGRLGVWNTCLPSSAPPGTMWVRRSWPSTLDT
jgi:hypothetical protein